MEPEGRIRKAPAEQKPRQTARVELEGRTRKAPAEQKPQQTARVEPAAWRAERAEPASRTEPAGHGACVERASGQGAWAALALQGAWGAPAGQGAWVEPARQGAWAAPAGQGAWARSRQGKELGRLRDDIGLWEGLWSMQDGRSLLSPPSPFPRVRCCSFVGQHRGYCSFVGHHRGYCSFIGHHRGYCSFIGHHRRYCSFIGHHRRYCSFVGRLWRCCSFVTRHRRHCSLLSWGTCQELHKSPKRQVVQPPHSPPIEGLIQGTIQTRERVA